MKGIVWTGFLDGIQGTSNFAVVMGGVRPCWLGYSMELGQKVPLQLSLGTVM